MKKERGPQATKNTRPMAGTVGASRAFSVRQVMTVRNGKTVAETDRSRGEARQRDFITAHSSILVDFLRATNNEPRATIFPRTQMRRTAATDSGWYYDRVPIVINSGCTQDSRRYAFQASPTVSHTGDGKGHGHR